MLLAPICFAVLVAQPSSGTGQRLLVNVGGFDSDRVESEVSLRLPEATVQTSWTDDERAASDDPVFVDLRRREFDGASIVRVITADGDGFVRVLPPSDSDIRIVATVLANLLIAIESEEVDADADTLALPSSASEQDVEAALAPLESVVSAKADEAGVSSPEPEVEAEAEPEPEVEPEPQPESELRPVPEETQDGGWLIGASVVPGVLLAGGRPAYSSVYGGAGASVALDVRAPAHWQVGIAFRGLGVRRHSVLLSRFSVAVRAGWALSQRWFEMPIVAEFAIEPFVLSDGVGNEVRGVGDSTISPSLRGGLWLSPGGRIVVGRGILDSLTIHADANLSGGFVVRDGSPVVLGVNDGVDGAGESLHRVGGLEVFLGAGVTLWFNAASVSK